MDPDRESLKVLYENYKSYVNNLDANPITLRGLGPPDLMNGFDYLADLVVPRELNLSQQQFVASNERLSRLQQTHAQCIALLNTKVVDLGENVLDQIPNLLQDYNTLDMIFNIANLIGKGQKLFLQHNMNLKGVAGVSQELLTLTAPEELHLAYALSTAQPSIKNKERAKLLLEQFRTNLVSQVEDRTEYLDKLEISRSGLNHVQIKDVSLEFQLKLKPEYTGIQNFLIDALIGRYNKSFLNPPQTPANLATHLLELFNQLKQWESTAGESVEKAQPDLRTEEEKQFSAIRDSLKSYTTKASQMTIIRQKWESDVVKFEGEDNYLGSEQFVQHVLLGESLAAKGNSFINRIYSITDKNFSSHNAEYEFTELLGQLDNLEAVNSRVEIASKICKQKADSQAKLTSDRVRSLAQNQSFLPEFSSRPENFLAWHKDWQKYARDIADPRLLYHYLKSATQKDEVACSIVETSGSYSEAIQQLWVSFARPSELSTTLTRRVYSLGAQCKTITEEQNLLNKMSIIFFTIQQNKLEHIVTKNMVLFCAFRLVERHQLCFQERVKAGSSEFSLETDQGFFEFFQHFVKEIKVDNSDFLSGKRLSRLLSTTPNEQQSGAANKLNHNSSKFSPVGGRQKEHKKFDRKNRANKSFKPKFRQSVEGTQRNFTHKFQKQSGDPNRFSGNWKSKGRSERVNQNSAVTDTVQSGKGQCFYCQQANHGLFSCPLLKSKIQSGDNIAGSLSSKKLCVSCMFPLTENHSCRSFYISKSPSGQAFKNRVICEKKCLDVKTKKPLHFLACPSRHPQIKGEKLKNAGKMYQNHIIMTDMSQGSQQSVEDTPVNMAEAAQSDLYLGQNVGQSVDGAQSLSIEKHITDMENCENYSNIHTGSPVSGPDFLRQMELALANSIVTSTNNWPCQEVAVPLAAVTTINGQSDRCWTEDVVVEVARGANVTDRGSGSSDNEGERITPPIMADHDQETLPVNHISDHPSPENVQQEGQVTAQLGESEQLDWDNDFGPDIQRWLRKASSMMDKLVHLLIHSINTNSYNILINPYGHEDDKVEIMLIYFNDLDIQNEGSLSKIYFKQQFPGSPYFYCNKLQTYRVDLSGGVSHEMLKYIDTGHRMALGMKETKLDPQHLVHIFTLWDMALVKSKYEANRVCSLMLSCRDNETTSLYKTLFPELQYLGSTGQYQEWFTANCNIITCHFLEETGGMLEHIFNDKQCFMHEQNQQRIEPYYQWMHKMCLVFQKDEKLGIDVLGNGMDSEYRNYLMFYKQGYRLTHQVLNVNRDVKVTGNPGNGCESHCECDRNRDNDQEECGVTLDDMPQAWSELLCKLSTSNETTIVTKQGEKYKMGYDNMSQSYSYELESGGNRAAGQSSMTNHNIDNDHNEEDNSRVQASSYVGCNDSSFEIYYSSDDDSSDEGCMETNVQGALKMEICHDNHFRPHGEVEKEEEVTGSPAGDLPQPIDLSYLLMKPVVSNTDYCTEFLRGFSLYFEAEKDYDDSWYDHNSIIGNPSQTWYINELGKSNVISFIAECEPHNTLLGTMSWQPKADLRVSTAANCLHFRPQCAHDPCQTRLISNQAEGRLDVNINHLLHCNMEWIPQNACTLKNSQDVCGSRITNKKYYLTRDYGTCPVTDLQSIPQNEKYPIHGVQKEVICQLCNESLKIEVYWFYKNLSWSEMLSPFLYHHQINCWLRINYKNYFGPNEIYEGKELNEVYTPMQYGNRENFRCLRRVAEQISPLLYQNKRDDTSNTEYLTDHPTSSYTDDTSNTEHLTDHLTNTSNTEYLTDHPTNSYTDDTANTEHSPPPTWFRPCGAPTSKMRSNLCVLSTNKKLTDHFTNTSNTEYLTDHPTNSYRDDTSNTEYLTDHLTNSGVIDDTSNTYLTDQHQNWTDWTDNDSENMSNTGHLTDYSNQPINNNAMLEEFANLECFYTSQGRARNYSQIVGRDFLTLKKFIDYLPDGNKRAKLQRRVLHRFLHKLYELSGEITHISEHFRYIHNACDCKCSKCAGCTYHEKYFTLLYREAIEDHEQNELYSQYCTCQCRCSTCYLLSEQNQEDYNVSNWLYQDSDDTEYDRQDQTSSQSDQSDLSGSRQDQTQTNQSVDTINLATLTTEINLSHLGAIPKRRDVAPLQLNGGPLRANSRIVEQVSLVNNAGELVQCHILVDGGAQNSTCRHDHEHLAQSVSSMPGSILVTTDNKSSQIPIKIGSFKILSSNKKAHTLQFIFSGYGTRDMTQKDDVTVKVCDHFIQKYNVSPTHKFPRSPVLTLGADLLVFFPVQLEIRDENVAYFSRLSHSVFIVNTVSGETTYPMAHMEQFLYTNRFISFRDTEDSDAEKLTSSFLGLTVETEEQVEEEIMVANIINSQETVMAVQCCRDRCEKCDICNVVIEQTKGSYTEVNPGYYFLQDHFNQLGLGLYQVTKTGLYIQFTNGTEGQLDQDPNLTNMYYYISQNLSHRVFMMKPLTRELARHYILVESGFVEANRRFNKVRVAVQSEAAGEIIEYGANSLLDQTGRIRQQELVKTLIKSCPEVFTTDNGQGKFFSIHGWKPLKLEIETRQEEMLVSNIVLDEHHGQCCEHAFKGEDKMDLGTLVYDDPHGIGSDPTKMFHKSEGEQFLDIDETHFVLKNSAARIAKNLAPRCSVCKKCQLCELSRSQEDVTDAELRLKMWQHLRYSDEHKRFIYEQQYIKHLGYTIDDLPSCQGAAYYRFEALEKALLKQGPEFNEKFNKCILDKVKSGEFAETEEYGRKHPEFKKCKSYHYISISFALKNESDKVRVVFDSTLTGKLPSGKTANINDFLPKIQVGPPIADVFQALRLKKYSIFFDISAHYTNVMLKSDAGVNRTLFFFREKGCNTDSKIIRLVSTRNNFGYRDAGCVAQLGCLRSLEMFSDVPVIKGTFQQERDSPISFYVDDAHICSDSQNDLQLYVKDTLQSLSKGGFEVKFLQYLGHSAPKNHGMDHLSKCQMLTDQECGEQIALGDMCRQFSPHREESGVTPIDDLPPKADAKCHEVISVQSENAMTENFLGVKIHLEEDKVSSLCRPNLFKKFRNKYSGPYMTLDNYEWYQEQFSKITKRDLLCLPHQYYSLIGESAGCHSTSKLVFSRFIQDFPEKTWQDEVGPHYRLAALQAIYELLKCENIKIDRYLLDGIKYQNKVATNVRLLIYVDASSTQVGFCAFFIVYPENDEKRPKSTFVFAKNRLNHMGSASSIPRLELRSVSLACAWLEHFRANTKGFPMGAQITLCSDSLSVLKLIRKNPQNMTRSLANQISFIKEQVCPFTEMAFCTTRVNQADLLTRDNTCYEQISHPNFITGGAAALSREEHKKFKVFVPCDDALAKNDRQWPADTPSCIFTPIRPRGKPLIIPEALGQRLTYRDSINNKHSPEFIKSCDEIFGGKDNIGKSEKPDGKTVNASRLALMALDSSTVRESVLDSSTSDRPSQPPVSTVSGAVDQCKDDSHQLVSSGQSERSHIDYNTTKITQVQNSLSLGGNKGGADDLISVLDQEICQSLTSCTIEQDCQKLLGQIRSKYEDRQHEAEDSIVLNSFKVQAEKKSYLMGDPPRKRIALPNQYLDVKKAEVFAGLLKSFKYDKVCEILKLCLMFGEKLRAKINSDFVPKETSQALAAVKDRLELQASHATGKFIGRHKISRSTGGSKPSVLDHACLIEGKYYVRTRHVGKGGNRIMCRGERMSQNGYGRRLYPLLAPTSALGQCLMWTFHKCLMAPAECHAQFSTQFIIPGAIWYFIALRRECARCQQVARVSYQPEQGSIPRIRLNEKMIDRDDELFKFNGSIFDHVIIDFLGPWAVHPLSVRKMDNTVTRSVAKSTLLQPTNMYILVFICAKSRILSLEVADMCDNNCTARAIENFTSQFGKPEVCYSDRGGSFVSLSKELAEAKSEEERQLVREKEADLQFLQGGLESFSGKLGINWVCSRSGHHHEAIGSAERVNKSIKDIMDQLIPAKFKMTPLEFHNICKKVCCTYNAIPVLASKTNPGRHLSRNLLIHGPHKAEFIHFSTGDTRHPWSQRWDVIQEMTYRLMDIIHDKYTLSLLLPVKWRENQKNPFQINDLVYDATLKSSGRNGNYHFGLATIKKFLTSQDGITRHAEICYRRLVTGKWITVNRHLSNLALVSRPESHKDGLNIFEMFLDDDMIKKALDSFLGTNNQDKSKLVSSVLAEDGARTAAAERLQQGTRGRQSGLLHQPPVVSASSSGPIEPRAAAVSPSTVPVSPRQREGTKTSRAGSPIRRSTSSDSRTVSDEDTVERPPSAGLETTRPAGEISGSEGDTARSPSHNPDTGSKQTDSEEDRREEGRRRGPVSVSCDQSETRIRTSATGGEGLSEKTQTMFKRGGENEKIVQIVQSQGRGQSSDEKPAARLPHGGGRVITQKEGTGRICGGKLSTCRTEHTERRQNAQSFAGNLGETVERPAALGEKSCQMDLQKTGSGQQRPARRRDSSGHTVATPREEEEGQRETRSVEKGKTEEERNGSRTRQLIGRGRLGKRRQLGRGAGRGAGQDEIPLRQPVADSGSQRSRVQRRRSGTRDTDGPRTTCKRHIGRQINSETSEFISPEGEGTVVDKLRVTVSCEDGENVFNIQTRTPRVRKPNTKYFDGTFINSVIVNSIILDQPKVRCKELKVPSDFENKKVLTFLNNEGMQCRTRCLACCRSYTLQTVNNHVSLSRFIQHVESCKQLPAETYYSYRHHKLHETDHKILLKDKSGKTMTYFCPCCRWRKEIFINSLRFLEVSPLLKHLDTHRAIGQPKSKNVSSSNINRPMRNQPKSKNVSSSNIKRPMMNRSKNKNVDNKLQRSLPRQVSRLTTRGGSIVNYTGYQTISHKIVRNYRPLKNILNLLIRLVLFAILIKMAIAEPIPKTGKLWAPAISLVNIELTRINYEQAMSHVEYLDLNTFIGQNPLFNGKALLIFPFMTHYPNLALYQGTHEELINEMCYRRGLRPLEVEESELNKLKQTLTENGYTNKILLVVNYVNGRYRWHDSGMTNQLLANLPLDAVSDHTQFIGLTMGQTDYTVELLDENVDHNNYFQAICQGSGTDQYSINYRMFNSIKKFRQDSFKQKWHNNLEKFKRLEQEAKNAVEYPNCKVHLINVFSFRHLDIRFTNRTFMVTEDEPEAQKELDDWKKLKGELLSVPRLLREGLKMSNILDSVRDSLCQSPLTFLEEVAEGDAASIVLIILIIMFKITVGVLCFICYQVNLKKCCSNFCETTCGSKDCDSGLCCCLYPDERPMQQLAVTNEGQETRAINYYFNARPRLPQEQMELREIFNEEVPAIEH